MAGVSGRSGMVAVGVVLVLVVVLLDLLRPSSTLRGMWHDLNDDQAPVERAVKDFQRTRGESLRSELETPRVRPPERR